jgi:quinol monooxygenase YgiN
VIIIAGSLAFEPSGRDVAIASIVDVTEHSRRDPGCIEYTWAEDLDEPNTFRFFECWESQDLFDAHLSAPHERVFGERTLDLITGATARVFEAVVSSG